jgi:O-acetyl-ADP-ribose deacetylase (regulator of RNase III)
MERNEPDLIEHVEAFPFPGTLVFGCPWEAAAEEAADAYQAWCEAPRAQRDDAFAAYRAAEEREAAAAEALRPLADAA